MKRLLLVLGLFAVLATPAASATRSTPKINVYAAASLVNVFPAIDAKETYQFAGSNTLATQIKNGAPADVFASANMTLPQQLHDAGYCSKPIVFTRNKLVIVVPSSNPAHISSIYDLTKKDVTVDVAAPGVPVGTYTVQILDNMNLYNAVEANVVSQETDVTTVLAHVTSGQVDAGFVYSTDAKSVPGKVKVIKIPAWAQPKVKYGICVVSASTNKTAAHAFIRRVLSAKGQLKLRKYGFLPRVKPHHHRHRHT
ncbi:MAG TPA: molybdate ABC transporter substrate-binding protein [Gaiellaceae bacterium]|jgi:molybdate transport system substrate-binding protein